MAWKKYKKKGYYYGKNGVVQSKWITRVEEREGSKGKYYLVKTKKYSYFVPAEDQNTVLALLNKVAGEYTAENGRLTWKTRGESTENYELVLKSNTDCNTTQSNTQTQNTIQQSNTTQAQNTAQAQEDCKHVDISKARALIARIQEDLETLRAMFS